MSMRFVLCACAILKLACFVRGSYNIESGDKNSPIARRYLSDSCIQTGARERPTLEGFARRVLLLNYRTRPLLTGLTLAAGRCILPYPAKASAGLGGVTDGGDFESEATVVVRPSSISRRKNT